MGAIGSEDWTAGWTTHELDNEKTYSHITMLPGKFWDLVWFYV